MTTRPDVLTAKWPSPASLAGAEFGLMLGALPAIAVGTDSPIGLAHWVLTSHLVALAFGCHVLRNLQEPPEAGLLRRFGFVLLTVGSLVCALMSDAYSLVAARLPQALGLACLLVVHPAEPRRLPVVFVAAGIVVGHVIGHCAGWRAVFVLTAMLGLLATRCDWRTVPLPRRQAPRRAGEHPAILACGLAGMIAAFNHYADFRIFGFSEAVVLAVGVVLFVIYARGRLQELIACRSRLVTLWMFSVVAGICLLPLMFHIRDVYRLALVGVVLGLVWSANLFRSVPVFSGLAAGIYAASYFLEFIPPAAIGAEFLKQESRVLITAAAVGIAGVVWSAVGAAGQMTSFSLSSSKKEKL